MTVQEARSWLESNDPKIMLGDRWNSTAFINEEDGHKVIKVKVNESLKDSIWTLRDILIQRNNTGDIEAVGYEVQVANSYFFTKRGAELPGANKREFIDNADFTWVFPPTNPANMPATGPGTQIPVGTPGGGGGDNSNYSQVSSGEIETAIPVADDKPAISDIKQYTKCFNDGKAAKSFTMTIYVDQPVAGSNDAYRIILPKGNLSSNNGYGIPTGINWQTPGGKTFDVGHTFVCFEKNNTDGTSVRQTLGFYPDGLPVGQKGAMKDDSGHVYDVSYTISVSQSQFNAGLTNVESDFVSKKYNLLSNVQTEYNCSDAAVSWMNAAGANLSSTGTYPFKCTPGSLGESIRTKDGANKNGGLAVQGKGPCQ